MIVGRIRLDETVMAGHVAVLLISGQGFETQRLECNNLSVRIDPTLEHVYYNMSGEVSAPNNDLLRRLSSARAWDHLKPELPEQKELCSTCGHVRHNHGKFCVECDFEKCPTICRQFTS